MNAGFCQAKRKIKGRCIIKPSVFPGTDRRFYTSPLDDAVFRKVPGTIVKLVHFRGAADMVMPINLDTNIEYEELIITGFCAGISAAH